jgi:hypothetical protein
MNAFVATFFVGMLLPLTATSAEVGQPISLLTTEARLQIARQDDFATNKSDYVERTRDEVSEWRERLRHPLGSESGDGKLYIAWNDFKSASQKLQTANGDTWERAMSAYERAKAKLQAAWHSTQSEHEPAAR